MRFYSTLTYLAPLLASASPLTTRAGGPSIVPIPTNCTLTNPFPHASCSNTTANGYMPSSNFTSTHLAYSAYFEGSSSPSAQATQCIQQCYGLGPSGACKSAMLGYQIPTPPGLFGTAGGVLETACLMFDTYLDPHIFVAAPRGQYLNATAKNIYCPL
ncbi:hypothetical protein LTR08_000016 [Meristemomyces frigidus]|nr:hypothetical protein LTR08_000016 [Meristemomyces frigidus]